MERRIYPIRADAYVLYEMVGQGASAVVQRAICVPHNEIIAVKIIDFERHGSDLSNISREAQTMILIDHPNVLKAHCSFVKEHSLWVVMPYMSGGSCLHIMKSAFPNGFEEVIIASVLKEVLKGLDYLHHHGHIHRDVKAGNILVDAKGGIKLGDFGVSACLFDSGDRQRSRNTFVGTPCWMAPEVMEQLHGYDFKADIWSFGITALELAHGHAPFSKYPPMKVLLMTLQNAPPCLDYESDKKFSRNFKHMIASCLVKDPTKRPTAHKLLKHTFFKQARSHDYVSRKILEGLAALGDRYQALKDKEENMLAQKKMPDGQKEEISQNEYKRGISGWNFDLEDLKAQASLIPSNEDVGKDQGVSNSFFENDCPERMPDRTYSRICSFKEYDATSESDELQKKSSIFIPPDETTYSQKDLTDGSDNELKKRANDQQDVMQLQSTKMDNLNQNCETELNGSAIFVIEQKASTTSEIDENNANGSTHNSQEPCITTNCSIDVPNLPKAESLKQQNLPQSIINSNGEVSHFGSPAEIGSKMFKPTATNGDDLDDKSKVPIVQQKGHSAKNGDDLDDKSKVHIVQQKGRSATNGDDLDDKSKIPIAQQKGRSATNGDDLDDKSKVSIVQQKGRFKVTSESIDFDKTSSVGLPKSHSMQVISQLQPLSGSPTADSTPSYGNLLFQQLHSIMQANIVQRDHILGMMKQMSTCDPANRSVDGPSITSPTAASEKTSLETANEREKELIQEVIDLQWRMACLQDEIQKIKAKNAQL